MDMLRRFWKRLKVPDGCWEWVGGKNDKGYGRFTIPGRKLVYTHRLMYHIFIDDIPKGLQVLHSCDNPKCCNPDHLWAGTQKDNIRDAVKKGRMKTGGHYGVSHSNAKLDETKVRKLRKYKEQKKKIAPLAREYGVSIQAAINAANGKTWKHVK